MNNIYIVKYWEPFPESEYGGMIVVSAESREQLKKLLKKNYIVTDKKRFKESVNTAKEVNGYMPAGVLAEFTT
jgi:hypothetical protein